MKHPFERIVGANLLLTLLIAGLEALSRGGMNARLTALVAASGAFAVLFAANVLLAIFSETKEGRQGHLISLVLILLIGFGNCAVQFSN